MAFQEVGTSVDACGRDRFRVVVPGQQDVTVRRGETAKIVFGNKRNSLDWYCENDDASSVERADCDHPFNAAIIARKAEGREVIIRFGLEA